jgi:hypothetical protein
MTMSRAISEHAANDWASVDRSAAEILGLTHIRISSRSSKLRGLANDPVMTWISIF